MTKHAVEGKTCLIATAYFHTYSHTHTENYWGALEAREWPAVQAWFTEHVQARAAGRDLVGAYLYTRAAVFSDLSTPNRMMYTLACHIHIESNGTARAWSDGDVAIRRARMTQRVDGYKQEDSK